MVKPTKKFDCAWADDEKDLSIRDRKGDSEKDKESLALLTTRGELLEQSDSLAEVDAQNRETTWRCGRLPKMGGFNSWCRAGQASHKDLFNPSMNCFFS